MDILEDVVSLLKMNKKRITNTKIEMIKFFLKNKEFVNVNEISDVLTTKPDTSTIYRNLEVFYEIGFLEKIQKDDKRWYKIREDYSKHEHYIVCERCKKKKILDFCPIIVADSNVEGFLVTGHKFELVGVCDKCANKNRQYPIEK